MEKEGYFARKCYFYTLMLSFNIPKYKKRYFLRSFFRRRWAS